MPKKTTPAPAEPGVSLTCQEASMASSTTYVPCGKPAVESIHSPRDGRAYNMCEMCADHNVSNRGCLSEGPATPDNPPIAVDQPALLEQARQLIDAQAPAAEPVYDYGDYVQKPTGEGELAQLSSLAEQLRMAEVVREEAQAALKKAQAVEADLAERQIPALMESIGMETFKTSGGLNVSVREVIRASLGTGKAKEDATDWLEANGHGAIIKLGVEVPFGRAERDREAAKALVAELHGKGVTQAAFFRKVEPSTLAALVRELLGEGRPVPEDKFNIHRQRIAKLK